MKNLSIRQIKCLITLILAVFLCGAPAVAQTQKIAVKLDMTKVPMKTVMNEIEKQTKYLFLYTDEIDTKRIGSIKADSKPLNEVLPLLFKDTDITYEITVPNIVLSKPVAAARPSAISGVVKDSGGLGIIGATVLIKGTTVGTTTGIDGDFALTVPASVDNPELSVSFIGYETRVVPIGSRTTFDITLANSSIEVEQVVVTALGIKRAEKALSYNVQQVNSDAITANKDANFINSLNGKVAGVNINASSAGVGGASKVIMRGMKSISQTSNALYVIDGVPMFTTAQEGGTEFSSQGTTAPIADINPEDIESISVLTGAAAAALYGSDAANGAIVVTTKKGQAGQLSVTATAGVEIMTPFVLPEFQNRYGTGNLTTPINVASYSWGKRRNRANRYGYDPREDYFRTGVANSESVSLSTGTEKNQTYFSAAAINSNGIVPNNSYDRYNFTFRNTSSFLNDKMRLDVGASYILQEDCNMINQGTYNNPLTGAYLFPRGDDWADIEMYERYDPIDKISKQYWPMGDGSITMQNPYWANYRNLRENRKDRYMLNAAQSYDILDWLNVSGRIRIDNSHNTYTEKMYASSNVQLTEQSANGLYGVTKTMDRQVYGDALLNINKTWVQKQGDFFVESPIILFASIIWYLKIYQGGKYCTFPHAIEFLNRRYEDIFPILTSYPELENYLSPFMDAWLGGAAEQLMGQIASAKIPLSRMISPQLYWVMSDSEFTLDINNPEEPKILCVGNNPDRQNIYGAALGLYNSRIVKLINKKGMLKSSVIIDELPTIYFKGLDNLIATARSNKVAVCLGFQDFSQLVRDYGDKEAKVVMNTVGNIFSGQVVGETAKTLSERFGKVLQKRQSISINRQDVSTSINTQMDSLIPPSKISGLTQGMFVGSVSDNFNERIEQKIFHCEIVVDAEKVRREEKAYKKIPVITDFTDGDGNDRMKETVQANYRRIKEEVKQIVQEELERIANDENLKHLLQQK